MTRWPKVSECCPVNTGRILGDQHESAADKGEHPRLNAVGRPQLRLETKTVPDTKTLPPKARRWERFPLSVAEVVVWKRWDLNPRWS